MEYRAGTGVWTHHFRNARVDDETLVAALAEHQLAFDRVLTEEGRWVRAFPRRVG